jgi:electron transfer flavoprotein beta subunit
MKVDLFLKVFSLQSNDLNFAEVFVKILVCVKQVPDLDSRFEANATGVWFDEANLAWRMNEYDEFAVEQAVQLKEQLGEAPEVTVLSIGPDRVLEVIRKALAMGCDCGVHLRDPEISLKDPWQVAGIIAAYAGGEGFDLIFTGMQSQDRASAQVGVIAAELLALSCVTTLVGFSFDNGAITVKRELEGGTRGVVRLRTPALLTCQLGLNVPRYPTLPNILKARKKEIRTIQAADLPTFAPMAATTGFFPPARNWSGIVLEGELNCLVDKLAEILQEKTAVLR